MTNNEVDHNTTSSQYEDRKQRLLPKGSNATNFLKNLAVDGPWLLTAIVPDGSIPTRTLKKTEEVRRFIVKHDADGENLYYGINPTRFRCNRSRAKAI